MERWTRLVLRFRWPVLAVWLVVIVAGFAANAQLSDLLSNTFTVPGTDSERVRAAAEEWQVEGRARGSADPEVTGGR